VCTNRRRGGHEFQQQVIGPDQLAPVIARRKAGEAARGLDGVDHHDVREAVQPGVQVLPDHAHGTQDGAVRRRVDATRAERQQRASSLAFGTVQSHERVGEQRPEQITQGRKLRFPEPDREERGARLIVAEQDALAPIEDQPVSVPVAQRTFDRQRFG
jgi:hypothetical protein